MRRNISVSSDNWFVHGGSGDDALAAHGGYNVLDWTDDGVAYWAISDMAAADLDKFAGLFRAASPDQ